jgi:hypothetical protein
MKCRHCHSERMKLVYEADLIETAVSDQVFKEIGLEPPKTPVIVVYEEHEGHRLRFCECGRDDRAMDRARLISASPDLLAACEALLNADLDADGEGVWAIASTDTERGHDAVEMARRAIAKARGQG